ncbi:sugar phosphate permease [Geothermobacter ehrlichii]|uniref:Sugar phosphate permease n=1 Tax=Geothermobacter ehrlichii TaxID=213224 RepID=A0A5D3WFR4_9BACT|nr:MFS transporter [Geothermobacter ehrlichii]TYO95033.1 sugar phosphate permease [Geothermobacter ehrlichii]
MRNIWFALSVTLMVQIFVSASSVTVSVLAPVVAAEIGISPRYIGLFVAILYMVAMISSLISGDFITRYGAVRVSQICLIFCAVGLMFSTLASIPMMILSAMLLGVGYGPVTPASSHVLMQNSPVNRRAFVFSFKQSGVPAGNALAGVMVPFLVLVVDWRGAALVVGGLCLLSVLASEPVRVKLDVDAEPKHSLQMRGMGKPIKMIFSKPELWKVTFGSLFYAMLQLCFITYFVTYLMVGRNLSLVDAGGILAAAQIGGISGRIFWGFVADRFFSPRVVLGFLGLSMSVVMVCFLSLGEGCPYPVMLILSVLFGTLAIGWNGVYLAELARLAPTGETGSVIGGGLFFTFLGVVVGPPIFGMIVTVANSYEIAFMVFATLCVVSGISILCNFGGGGVSFPVK